MFRDDRLAHRLPGGGSGDRQQLVLNSPSNPSGSAYTRPELEALAEVVLKHQLLVISDEIYEKIVFDGFEHVSIAYLSDDMKRSTVVINGVSKCFAMTGWCSESRVWRWPRPPCPDTIPSKARG